MKINTYDVVPLSPNVGLIECLPDVISYKELAKSDAKANLKDMVSSRQDFLKAMKRSHEERAKKFKDNLANWPEPEKFKQSLLAMSSTYEGMRHLV